MVKAVVAEETQCKLAEDRLCESGLPSQVGLLVGKLSSHLDRGFVFDLIPTPPNDAGEPACSLIEGDNKKKGSKGKSLSDSTSLYIDKDWVAEHARQVSRMLLGGLKVIGIYVWANEGSFKNSTLAICQCIKGVAEAAPLLKTDLEERLLVHISYSPRRWTCRNCSLTSNITSSSLRPCDFKVGRALSSLQTFKCMYNFDLRLPVCLDNGSNLRKLSDILRHGISCHAKELRIARALVDGKLETEIDQGLLDGNHEVEFLLPFTQEISTEACSKKEIDGALIFTGSVSSYAYINAKEPISQALSDIKEDIIISLQSRLDIVCDEADGELDSNENVEGGSHVISSGKLSPQLDLQLLRKSGSLIFPRRVFVPWLAGTYICDYVQPFETTEVVKEHCVELMSMEATGDALTIMELEMDAPIVLENSFWDILLNIAPPHDKKSMISEKGISDEIQKGTKSKRLFDFNMLVAVLVLVISIIVGLALLFFKAI